MLFFSTLVILSSLGIIHGQPVHNIPIQPGPPYEGIKNPEYPDGVLKFGSTIQWNLVVESDSTINIICDDIRMGQSEPWTPECPHVYISFDEGNGEKKICGQNEGGYVYKSKGPRLTVRLVSKEGSGFVKCSAYNTRELPATHLDLRPDGHVQIISTPDKPIPHFDQTWTLRSTPESRISFQCSISLTTIKEEGCYKDFMTVDDGEQVTEYCGAKDLVLFSKKNFAKLRIQLNEFGNRNVRCIVQAVTGPNANEFKNVVAVEIDSSEHGVTRGRKGTTCDCGRANKPPSRITHGKEVRPNEYPWMTLLHVYYSSGGGVLFYTCGSSIITHTHVLTAAHCVVRKETDEIALPENVRVQLAVHDRSKDSENRKEVVCKELYIHDGYLQNRTHDVAVLHTYFIEFSLLISPICLTPVELPIMNQRIQIMGWGQTETGKGSDVLRKARAIAVDRRICNMARWEICTLAIPSATCFGDSGGPQVWVDPETNRYTEVSLASRAYLDCRSGPNTQTNVAYFYQWIQDAIQKSDPSQIICEKIN